MDASTVQRVRRFNRTVTQRVGVLNDHFMGRDRPLGEARVLWEVGLSGREVRDLRDALGLDSGYLSRLLRALEADGLVEVLPGEPDRRVRVARLTPAGRREWRVLDARSDALAWSLMAPLNEAQRARLAEAMDTVERLLTAGLVEFAVVDPASADAQACLDAYFAELDDRFEAGFDPSRSISADIDELTEPAGLLLLARLRGRPVGCGALKFHGRGPAELKRMWVHRDTRGLGVGRQLLAELEEHAAARGIRTVRLETNRALVEAIDLYRTSGYEEVDRFNEEPYAHHWFQKRLRRPA
jgi:DNA-binding MarR family transcriptional regulator/N-acetylglutamate synthase-like GNAT family acetyltransferase